MFLTIPFGSLYVPIMLCCLEGFIHSGGYEEEVPANLRTFSQAFLTQEDLTEAYQAPPVSTPSVNNPPPKHRNNKEIRWRHTIRNPTIRNRDSRFSTSGRRN